MLLLTDFKKFRNEFLHAQLIIYNVLILQIDWRL
jgi:hypothetical protein